MKNKLKNLYDTLSDSLHDSKKEMEHLKVVADIKKNLVAGSKSSSFAFAFDTIVEAVKESVYSRQEARTIREVISDFGDLPALNARYGSFETFMKKLELPSTDIVSLYSLYPIVIEKQNTLVIMVPDVVAVNSLTGTFSFKLKGQSPKSFIFNVCESEQMTMYEDVQIGIRPETNNPYFLKVKYPMTVACISVTEVPYDETHQDLNCSIKKILKLKYPESKSVSDIFTQSILCQESLNIQESQSKSNWFKLAAQKIYDYRVKRSNSH